MPNAWTIALSSDSMLPGLLFAGGILLAVVLLLRQWRRTAGKRTELDRHPRERIDELHERATAGRDGVEELMSDAEQLTRRLAATLDNKAARLEQLIDEAERTLARLERATGSPVSQPGPTLAAHADEGHEAIYRLADAGRAPAEIARELNRPVGQVELILNLRKSG